MTLILQFIPVRNFVFVDESGFESNMSRSYGWARKEKRLYEHKSLYKKKRWNVLGAISERGIEHYEIQEKSVNGAIFCEFLHNLCRKIPEKSIIVLDNHPIHKVKMVQNIVNQYKISLLYLPPYSPDLNPIEQTWSVAKSHVRKSPKEPANMRDKICYVLDHLITAEIASKQIGAAGYWDLYD